MNTQQDVKLTEFKQMLKKHSLKATPQRLAVHIAMMELGHASADMVTDYIIKNSETKITTASVYNILTQLANIGIYNHRMTPNNKMYFDVNTFKHIHLYDSVNQTFTDILDEELMTLINSHLKKRRFRGYSVDNIDIQLIAHPTRKKTISNSSF